MNRSTTRRLWNVFFVLNWVVIVWFWWMSSGAGLTAGLPDAAIALGRLAGLLATYLILLQFFFIGRTPWLERVFGLDTLTRKHHRNGQWGLVILLTHPFLIVWGNGALARIPFLAQLFLYFGIDDIVLSASALVLFIILVASSITLARSRLRYEWWYAVHLIAYAAVFLALPHQLELGTTVSGSNVFHAYWIFLYVLVFAHHAVFRFVRPVALFIVHRFCLERVARENHNTVSLTIGGRNLDRFRVRPGQFLILRFLRSRLWWQAHPFSLSMVPDGRHLRVTVKASGDFTDSIDQIPVGTLVLIDGPYGVFTEYPGSLQRALFIAGGIGITPIRSLFEQMVVAGKECVLLFANRTRADIVFGEELRAVAARGKARIVDILSDDPDFPGEQGRLDADRIRRLVPDAATREVYLCGPIPMMDVLLPQLRSLGVPQERLHYEKFEL